MVILIFAHNKANTNTNNSFYIVRSPGPLVQRILYVYLKYPPVPQSYQPKSRSLI